LQHLFYFILLMWTAFYCDECGSSVSYVEADSTSFRMCI